MVYRNHGEALLKYCKSIPAVMQVALTDGQYKVYIMAILSTYSVYGL